MDSIKLIDDLIIKFGELQVEDWGTLDALTRRAEMLIRNLPVNREYLVDLKQIDFETSGYLDDGPEKEEFWLDTQKKMRNLLNTIKDELALFGPSGKDKKLEIMKEKQSNEIFIVHGKDEAMKQSVARTLEKLNLKSIILHEKPSKGRTIIEKFIDYSHVNFAIVLLSPDDLCYPKEADPKEAKPRARQNVILELGYFIGKLGRERAMALYRKYKDFEMPSDYKGVIFLPFDDEGHWRFELVKELKACDYDVDANKLIDQEKEMP